MIPTTLAGRSEKSTTITTAEIWILLFTIFLASALREIFFMCYFILPYVIYRIVPYRASTTFLTIWAVAFCGFIFNYVRKNEFFLGNLVVSSYIHLFVFFILFSYPIQEYCHGRRGEAIHFYINALTVILFISDCIGFVQYALYYHGDAFIGFYGRHGVAMHGLALLNSFLVIYYYFKLMSQFTLKTAFLLGFFFVSFVFCFYGLGVIILMVAFLYYYVIVRKQFIILVFLVSVMAATVVVIDKIDTTAINYNMENIRKTIDGLYEVRFETDVRDMGETPRKLYAYVDYANIYTDDPLLMLFGAGPGMFNSRVAFLLNGDYAPHNVFSRIFGVSVPYESKRFIFPLWDSEILSKPWQDGTRNQPFSSIVAFLAEWGLIFSLGIFFLFRKKHKAVARRLKYSRNDEKLVLSKTLIVLSACIFLHLFFDNLSEFTEFLAYVLFFKFVEIYSLSDDPIAHETPEQPALAVE